ncbi:hypothetical protein BOTBODRAFT_33185 [Botryobasidium botryosum FD-172 SS1]|uniref:Protein phosphatase n=1 Tax=Botryobasidium botryosum (strain FD-172 SS1) TaxID=930990 RepID=A0A067MEU3_BOTB1|nr:hypothetical protein BOTBODRAFT_33185 [Botryobasidium botryosum FD-172 SS1]
MRAAFSRHAKCLPKSHVSHGIRSFSTGPRPYKIHMGVSYAGKPPFEDEADMSRSFPNEHPIAKWRDRLLKWPKGLPTTGAGQDFFYVQNMKNDSGISFGVADGVGGWGPIFDPSLFSQAIMYHASRVAAQRWAGEPETDPIADGGDMALVDVGTQTTPEECMQLAYRGVLREKFVDGGASTATIMQINSKSGLLQAANLGDSGFSIFRSSSLYYSQAPQTHYFNCPRQLAKYPAKSRWSRDIIADFPEHAATYSTRLRHGDVVIAFTDGLSDNVWPSELLQCVTHVLRSNVPEARQAQDLADICVHLAMQSMHRYDKVSPFEMESQRSRFRHYGGKVDDVTVIVALISEII